MSSVRGPDPDGDGLVYWVDRCLGVHDVPHALRSLGASVRLYRDTYPGASDVADLEWIPEIARRGWVIVTKDTHITHNAAERRALVVAGARFVSLVAAGLTGTEQARCIAEHFRTFDGVVRARTPPTILRVTRRAVLEWKGADERWSEVKRKRSRA